MIEQIALYFFFFIFRIIFRLKNNLIIIILIQIRLEDQIIIKQIIARKLKYQNCARQEIKLMNEKIQGRIIHKIHRRKNDQIAKQYVCTQNCGKAYGSYAALYTHIKNKHADAKLPQMKSNQIKVPNAKPSGKKGRPPPRQQTQPYKRQASQNDAGQCKLCLKTYCDCIQQYDKDEKNNAIQIMSNEDFINFINEVGGLAIQDKFSFVRNTQDDYQFFSQKQINDLVKQFNQKFQTNLNLQYSNAQKLVQYLSFTSRYWQKQFIKQLYFVIFIIKDLMNKRICSKKDIIAILEKDPQFFKNALKCSEVKKEEFQGFCNIVKVL